MGKKDSKQKDDEKKTNRNVMILQPAFLSMSMHAISHATSSVHGVLLGQFTNDNEVKVSDAVPICHGPPTAPLVETALSLVQQLYKNFTIVGWYTAPELLNDDRPGPVALRIVSNLEGEGGGAETTTNNTEPILLVLRNGPLGKCISSTKTKTTIKESDEDKDEKDNKGGDDEDEDVMIAYGKDFGKQWLEPLPSVTFVDKTKTLETIQQAYVKNIKVNDFVDHLDSPDSNAAWYHSNSVFTTLGIDDVNSIDANYGT